MHTQTSYFETSQVKYCKLNFQKLTKSWNFANTVPWFEATQVFRIFSSVMVQSPKAQSPSPKRDLPCSVRYLHEILRVCLPVRRSSSGIGSTELLNSNMEPRRPMRGLLLLVLAVLPLLPPSRSIGWLTPTPSSISKTLLFSFAEDAITGSEDSELALDRMPFIDPELSLRNKPITDAVFGWSMPPWVGKQNFISAMKHRIEIGRALFSVQCPYFAGCFSTTF